ncbi:MAG: hypothetical protein AAGJ93_01505 [Bacteroidota bacterium]
MDYRNGMTISFDDSDVVGKEWFLTSINIYERDGLEYFGNFSYSGLNNGYVLDYKDVLLRFENDNSYGKSVLITDAESIGGVRNIYGTGRHIGWNKGGMLTPTEPLFLVVQAFRDSSLYYYYDDSYRERTREPLRIPADDFEPFEDMRMLRFEDTISDITIALHADLGSKPLLFFSKVKNNKAILPFPKEMNMDRCDLIIQSLQIDKKQSVDYYTSITDTEAIIKIPVPAYEIGYDEYGSVNIQCDGEYAFFKVLAISKDEETGTRSSWFFTGPLYQKMNFKIPDLPVRILDKHEIDFDSVNHALIHLLTSDIDKSLQDLDVPMRLSAANWRVKNNCLEVTPFITLNQ